MNIALSAVVIFILLIPPIAFYVSYSFGRFQKAGPKFSLFDGVLISAIVSLFVHGIAIAFIHQEIRLDILLKIVGGDLKEIENKLPNYELAREVKDFAVYNFYILFISVDLVLIDAIVDTKDGTMIYSGVLKEFVCNGEELDRIYLEEATRREFKKKDEERPTILLNETGTAQYIPGNIFTLSYKYIINLNLRFIVLEYDIHEQ